MGTPSGPRAPCMLCVQTKRPHDILRAVTFRSAIGHLFTVLAIVGLLLGSVLRPVMAMPVGAHTSSSDAPAMSDTMAAAMPADMPCCPEKAPVPDCGKDCPCMTFCAGTLLHSAPLGSLFVPLTLASIVVRDGQSDLLGIAQTPPKRPPKI
jgi:hypothetical protein